MNRRRIESVSFPLKGVTFLCLSLFAGLNWVFGATPLVPKIGGSSADRVLAKNVTDSFAGSCSGGCPPYSYSWTFENASGEQTSNQQTAAKSFGASALGKKNKVRLTVEDSKENSKSVEIWVYVPQFEATEVKFTSDHGVMIDKNDNPYDPSPAQVAFPEPEWSSVLSVNDPITHTRNENVSLEVKIKVTPSDTPLKSYLIEGESPSAEAGFSFDATKDMSGGNNSIPLTSSDKLEDKIYKVTSPIDWTFSLNGSEAGTFSTGGGGHKVYVLNGTQNTSLETLYLTEYRVNWAVTKAADTTTAIDALFEFMDAYAPHFNGITVPANIWNMMTGVEKGDCYHSSWMYNRSIQILGYPPGNRKQLYVLTPKSSKESFGIGDNQTDVITTALGTNTFYLWYYAGLANRWEGALKYPHRVPGAVYFGPHDYIDTSCQGLMEQIVSRSAWIRTVIHTNDILEDITQDNWTTP